MKKNKIKGLLMVAMIAVLLTAAIGGTVAWIVDKTNEVENVFTPAQVDTEIHETMSGNVKSSVKIYNVDDPEDLNVDAYVRVAVVANWVKDNNIVEPWAGTISYNSSDWCYCEEDGFYYYREVLEVGKESDDLLSGSVTYTEADVPVEGAHLEMTIIHQSVQANPTSAVVEMWGVTVAEDKTISK